jgi:predicted TIM-barrel fold metal-dependent hydrolase
VPVERLIDVHRHLWNTDWFPPDHRRAFAVRAAHRTHPPREVEEILPRVGKGYYDPNGSGMVEQMDELSIDISIVMVLDWGMAYLSRGMPDSLLPIREINRQTLSLREKYPGRVYGFAGVDPRRAGAVDLLELAVREWGAVGLKVYPPCGFFASDSRAMPLYQKACDLGIPVLIHCGGSMFDLLNKYAIPEPIEEVAVKFPDLQVIMGHVNLQARFESGAYWRGLQIAAGPTNIFLDLTEWQVKGALEERNLPDLFHALGVMRDTVGAHRILWGSDLPWRGREYELTRRWAEIFRNLPDEAAKYDVGFSQSEAELIAHGNAERLIGIKD